MERTERLKYAALLRTDQGLHHNCCQSVLMCFAEEMGLDLEEAFRLAGHMGAGMRCGSACGTVTAAALVLGAAGRTEEEVRALLEDFRARRGTLDCEPLLAGARARGEEKKPFCDGLVLDMVARLDALLEQPAEETVEKT